MFIVNYTALYTLDRIGTSLISLASKVLGVCSILSLVGKRFLDNNHGRGIYSLFNSPPFWTITSFQSRSTSAISQFAEQNLSFPSRQIDKTKNRKRKR